MYGCNCLAHGRNHDGDRGSSVFVPNFWDLLASRLLENAHLSYLVYLLAQIYHGTITLRIAKRMYCINYLFRADVPTSDVVCIYTSIIRSVFEYACPVWHPGLAKNYLKTLNVYVYKTLFKTVVSSPFIY